MVMKVTTKTPLMMMVNVIGNGDDDNNGGDDGHHDEDHDGDDENDVATKRTQKKNGVKTMQNGAKTVRKRSAMLNSHLSYSTSPTLLHLSNPKH